MRERNSAIELLRIVAIYMIIMCHLTAHGLLHVLGQGNQFEIWAGGGELNKLFAIFLIPGGRVGVGLFFLITGYFQVIKDSIRVKNIIIETFFYSVLIASISFLIGKSNINDLFLSLVPLSSNKWWYVSSYIVLIISSSYINRVFLNLTRNKKILSIFFTWVFMYCIPYNGAMYYSLERGVLFYLIGAYIRTEISLLQMRKYKVIFLFTFVVFWLLYLPIGYYFYSGFNDNVLYTLLLDAGVFNGVIIPICSSTLFLYFITIKPYYNKWINLISTSVFGIYLLHDSPYRRFLWDTVFNIQSIFASDIFPVLAVMAGISILIINGMIDLFRQKVFLLFDKK